MTLVTNGAVDEDVLSLILGRAQEPAEQDLGPLADAEQAVEAPLQLAETAAETVARTTAQTAAQTAVAPAAAGTEAADAAEEAEGQSGADAAETAGAPRSGASQRKPIGMAMGRPFVPQKGNGAA
ncbi:hypothetical protein D3C87_1618200 [compost metagenome]